MSWPSLRKYHRDKPITACGASHLATYRSHPALRHAWERESSS